jgi:hypothetical protein
VKPPHHQSRKTDYQESAAGFAVLEDRAFAAAAEMPLSRGIK